MCNHENPTLFKRKAGAPSKTIRMHNMGVCSHLTRAFLAVLGATFIACSASRADDAQFARWKTFVDAYNELAFLATDRLEKFADPPRIVFLCSSPQCQDAVLAIKKRLPVQIFVEVVSGSADQELKDEIVISFEGQRAEQNFREAVRKVSGVKLRGWGDSRCGVSQFSIGYEVTRLVLTVDPQEGTRNNVFCVLSELRRGSGGRSSGTYEDYKSKLSAVDQQAYQNFLDSNAAFLSVHWANTVPPGTFKEETRRRILEIVKQKGSAP